MRFLGRGSRDPGEARLSPPNPDDKNSASEKWMRHFIWSNCPICHHGDTVAEDRYCEKGLLLRQAALAEMKAIPGAPKKPAATPFNPSIEGKRA
jgi:hypothetical protein